VPHFIENVIAQPENYQLMEIDKADVIQAINAATRRRKHRKDFRPYLTDTDRVAESFLRDIASGEYLSKIEYRELRRRNTNGKDRDIKQPSPYTLILQHIAIIKVQPYYDRVDTHIGLNCKKGCGINAKVRSRSVNKKLKHIFFDCREYTHALIIDQRQCYAHVSRKTARRALKNIGVPRALADYYINVSFYGREFPIGTPTSPLLHHIIMHPTDRLLRQMSSRIVRYADDCFAAFKSKAEAHAAMWRVKNLWWYTLQIRAKPQHTRVVSLSDSVDFCGNIYYRNADRGITDHDKGYVLLRDNIARRAAASTPKNYPSYFGLLKGVDGFNFMLTIENRDMNIRKITESIRVHRPLDAQPIDIEELVTSGAVFDILDYEVRLDGNKQPDWCKCIIALNEHVDADGVRPVRQFSGGFRVIAQFLQKCADNYADKTLFLPLEECQADKHNGYIIKGSLHLITSVDAHGQYIYN
jgi:hypothetical protein